MKRRLLLATLIVLTLFASACSSAAEQALETEGDAGAPAAEFIDGEPTAIPLVDEETSGEPDEVAQDPDEVAEDAEDTEPVDAGDGDEPEEAEEPDDPEAETCEAPELVGFFVDVAADDPDGGLNMRATAGPDGAVVATIARGGELITRGECEVIAGREWWLMTVTDGSQDGWVAARFLSNESLSDDSGNPEYTPGVGNPVNDTDNVGVSAATLEELVEIIAQSYVPAENLVITEIVEPSAADATGGEATYEATGLRDHSTNGYVLELAFSFDRNEDGGEIVGYTATRITASPLCTRAVSPDGQCV